MNRKELLVLLLFIVVGGVGLAVSLAVLQVWWQWLIVTLALILWAMLGAFISGKFSDSARPEVARISAGPRADRVKHIKVKKVPGIRLLQVADFFFSAKTVEETFKPAVADWHAEYFETLKQNRFIKARWINVRYTYRFILAMGLSKVFSVIKSFKSVIK